MTEVLRVDRLHVDARVGQKWLPVVTDVSFAVRAGEIMGLVGESGSGKTVTCLSVLGLLPRTDVRVRTGAIWFHDRDLTAISRRDLEDTRGRSIAMIPQEPSASLNPAFTVGDQMTEILRRHEKLGRAEARRRAAGLLDEVGIPAAASRLDDYPHHFSGGMCQRVLIAMALACNPEIIIADEPTTALDVTVQAQILRLIREKAAQHNAAVLLVTHDMGVVAEVCDRVVVMYAGQIVESADIIPIFHRPRHPYTERLLAATPRMMQPDETDLPGFAYIPGSMPRPGTYATGCRFGPRCAFHEERCDAAEVPLRTLPEGNLARCVRTDELDLAETRSRA
ncbi:ABC transporter ATP-binding protein [Dactylosporangium fulvum]|uniref:ABC transporter ATP-binding protein n=1 Tax=Dactylosporangium fulvum TaxID=53359 RepID=A0ABY5VSK6_9ACTN|nr:ABC transporter ATP-binding protein [Dactylosporangium fulvum]UWP80074.1 ABC transporter ATP-binding protein [Dactylosporangium fulvum]